MEKHTSNYPIRCLLTKSGFEIDSSSLSNDFCKIETDINKQCELYKSNDFYISFQPENPYNLLEKGFNFEIFLCLIQKFQSRNNREFIFPIIKFNFLQGLEITNVKKRTNQFTKNLII